MGVGTSPASTVVVVLLLLVFVVDVRVDARGISIFQVAKVTRELGLELHDKAAERAFFAKDFRKVKGSDFRALQARAEKAKKEEERLSHANSHVHAVICNKVIKVGTEAIIGAIKHDKAFTKEHLIKFNKNVEFLQGRSCKDKLQSMSSTMTP